MRTLDSTFPLGRVTVGVGLAYANTDFMRSNFNVIGFDVVDEDHRHDLALLKMRANPFQGEVGGGIVIGDKPLEPLHGVPVLRLDRPRDGEAIAVSGYPLSETVMVTNQGVIASSWSVEVDDIPHPTLPGVTSPEIRDLYLGDVQSNPGNSGGPVYATEDGAFVGVLVAGRLTSVQTGSGPASIAGVPLYHDAGLSLIVPTKYVTEMLDRNGVKWDSGS
jgi:S1-C subfamily serine protease